MPTPSFARARTARLLLAGAALAALTPMPAGLASPVQEDERPAERMRAHGAEMERAAAEMAEAIRRLHEQGFHEGHSRREVEDARRQMRDMARQMRDAARDAARQARPSAEEMRRLREHARAQARWSARERDEMRRALREAMREMRREMQRARDEMRRALREAHRGVI